MKQASITQFPIVYPPDAAHRLTRGGMPVKVKHVHPEYPSEDDARQALEDVYRASLAEVSAMQQSDAAPERRKERTA